MKLTVERDGLHAALGRVAKIIAHKSSMPILTHLRLRAGGANRIALTGTDLDIEAMTAMDAEVDTPGAALIPAHMLTSIVAKIPAGAQIQLESESEGRVTIRSGRSRFALQVLPESDFPELAHPEPTSAFEIDAKTLLTLLSQVDFAISNEETRYYLNGVFMHIINGADGPMLRAVATDGHRLARAECIAPPDSANLPGIIIPSKTVSEIKRLSKDATSHIQIQCDGKRIQLIFGGKDTTLISKLVDGTFPDYARVVPTDHPHRVTFPRGLMVEAAERVSCIASERGRSVKMAISDSRLGLSITDPCGGDAAEEIECAYDAAPVDIGVNVNYLIEALSVFESEEVHLNLADPASPLLFMEREGSSLQIVLMPMRL
jgi:DNA polymerase-3 subunit beta